VQKVTAVWSGWPGAPGYSNFYFSGIGLVDGDYVAMTAAVRTFFAGFTLCLPTGISILVSPVVQEIDPATGQLTGEHTASTVPTAVAGAGGTNFASPVGACVIWRTSTSINGRLLKGKTFLVPLGASSYDTDGTLLASRLAELRTAATTLADFGSVLTRQLVVWHRPVAGAGGSIADVASATVNDRSAVLRTRRV
jgi:hypothetical protein